MAEVHSPSWSSGKEPRSGGVGVQDFAIRLDLRDRAVKSTGTYAVSTWAKGSSQQPGVKVRFGLQLSRAAPLPTRDRHTDSSLNSGLSTGRRDGGGVIPVYDVD